VTLPHTWNAMDGQDGGGNYYRGTGWYRRHVTLPDDAEGKKIFIEFEGANTVTDVYVNGTSVGQHRGGFARFRFDVTSELSAGQDNVIAVRASNARVEDVAPLNADFTFFGGLYRPARLLITEPVHVDVLDFASPKVYLDTPEVSATSATLRARVRVTNDGQAEQAVTVTSVVVAADDSVAQQLTASGTIAAGGTEELTATGTLSNPHLWAGRIDPYLYTVRVELSVQDRVVDVVTQPLGIRWYSVDANQGFFLNGEYLDLRGVNLHQDRLNMGWAITEAERDEDMALIEELGATVVRLAHYQHSDYFHSLADRAGMVLWAEIPLVNEMTNSSAFRANARQQMTELIRQNYNHPSILFWGIGNEQRSNDAPTNSLLDELAELTRQEDPGRLVTYAHCCSSDTSGLPAHSDVVGYNTYYGWYDNFGDTEDFGAWADGLHVARPDWKIGVSEYGAGASVVQHQDPPTQPDPYGSPHPEEWQNLVHEVHWQQMSTRPYLWSKIVWTMFDFASDGRNEGDTPSRNDKGLVTYDRSTKKDAFFWYKANWTSEPLVYITSRRYTPRTSASVTVKVYANVPSVELSVNGTSVGSQSSNNRIFIFHNVALDAGNNEIQATGDGVTDSVTWVRQ
jgi:beta-galactosidase